VIIPIPFVFTSPALRKPAARLPGAGPTPATPVLNVSLRSGNIY